MTSHVFLVGTSAPEMKGDGAPTLRRMWIRRRRALLVTPMLALAVVAACSSADPEPTRAAPETTSLDDLATPVGEGEGAIRVLAMRGDAEAGRSDPDADWISDYEVQTGCRATIVQTSPDGLELDTITSNEWDVASVSGDLVRALVEVDRVAAVDTDLLPNYRSLFPYLAGRPWNTLDGRVYGVPIGWRPGPTTGDSWTTIAAAALGLQASRPDLEITDPFALDPTQFDAAVDAARGLVGAPLPTGLARADAWTVSAGTKHRNCAYMWLDWMLSADTNAQVAEWRDLAPATRDACDLTIDPEYCTTTTGASDLDAGDRLRFWTTPLAECVDGRTDVVCADREDWDVAWAEISGPG